MHKSLIDSANLSQDTQIISTMFTIQTGMQISTIQSIFNTTFPYLKLEFFKAHNKPQTTHSNRDLWQPGAVLPVRVIDWPEPDMTVTGEMPVATLVKQFRIYFGLDVQVFRKSGKAWLGTTFTGDWSLQKQNEQGKELSNLALG